MRSIALLHPGSMGAAIARELISKGDSLLWLPQGRGQATSKRAGHAGMTPIANAAELFHRAEIVLSVCPPGTPADDIADLAVRHQFKGLFVDLNSISPRRTTAIAGRLATAGAVTVDGSIIGTPPTADRPVKVYLSGAESDVGDVADLFAGTQCIPSVLDHPVGAASALKIAYSSYQKAAYVMAAMSHALAHHHDLSPELLHEALQNTPGTPLADPQRITVGAAKAWRWVPEFAEMTDAFTDAGITTDVQPALAELLARWADFKDGEVTIEQAITRL